MTLVAFSAAALALLIAPGPTNALLAVAGAQAAVQGRVARLVPAVLAGYLASILPLAYAGAEAQARWPLFATGLKLAAAAWVMVLALRLWRAGAGRDADGVTARAVFLTTLLNPKALVVALVLLPQPQDPAFAARLALFCLMAASASFAWGTLGALAQRGRGGPRRTALIGRAASVLLAVVSLSLIAGVFAA
ncbi:MAG: hypothetical protein ACKVPY_15125 [Paracoccaceae bacterium]